MANTRLIVSWGTVAGLLWRELLDFHGSIPQERLSVSQMQPVCDFMNSVFTQLKDHNGFPPFHQVSEEWKFSWGYFWCGLFGGFDDKVGTLALSSLVVACAKKNDNDIVQWDLVAEIILHIYSDPDGDVVRGEAARNYPLFLRLVDNVVAVHFNSLNAVDGVSLALSNVILFESVRSFATQFLSGCSPVLGDQADIMAAILVALDPSPLDAGRLVGSVFFADAQIYEKLDLLLPMAPDHARDLAAGIDRSADREQFYTLALDVENLLKPILKKLGWQAGSNEQHEFAVGLLNVWGNNALERVLEYGFQEKIN
ncbi:UNVERIFIED_CONTAM: hypothetical protein HDU68_002031 [Siphonaria sp. JEL0065]|nr:hypothetical protein HDU68_002031 [Siphonaria sp. JEL0065]